MGRLHGVCGLVVGMAVCVVGGLYAVEPTIPLYLYNGNVGVGTETPTAMLDVSGNFRVRGPAVFNGFVGVGYDTDGLGKLSFHNTHTTPGNRYFTGFVHRNSTGAFELESSDYNNLNIQFGSNVSYGTLSFQSVSWNVGTAQKTATTRMVIKGDSGNVGIGTTTPKTNLEIVGTLGNYGPVLRLSSTGSTAVPGQQTGSLEFFNSDADIPSINAYIRAFAGPSYGVGGELVFGTQETWQSGILRERMRINSAGKVGIGTSSPSSNFHVVGNTGELAMSLTESGTTSRWYQQAYSSYLMADNDWLFYTKGTEKMKITSAGNVGIGTTTPSTKLQVIGTVNATAFVGDGSGLTNVSGGWSKNTGGEFYTDKNLGVGTSSPTARLEVVGSAFVSGGSLVNKNPDGPYYGPTIETSYTGGWAREYGFVRAGKTGKLFSLGAYGSGDTLMYGYIGGMSTSWTSVDSPWMVFKPSGNVGIGTTSPTSKLQVAGTFLATDTASYPRTTRQYDARQRKPSDQSPGTFSFGFGSFNNNNVWPYADTLTFNTWGDSSGGNLNMIAFNKSTIGMRIYSGAFGSESLFSTYKDVVLADTSGNVGIGTTTPTHPLHVSGNALISSRMAINAAIDNAYTLNVGGAIRATELVLNLNGWADYVFEPDYKLMPLSEVESFVKQNRHLPGVPSEASLKASGLNMAKVQTLQMQKIEELTLYVIALEKQNKALEARLEALEKGLAR